MSEQKGILEFLNKYVSKILIGINGRIEVFKLANKQDNKIGAKVISSQGGKTTINQVMQINFVVIHEYMKKINKLFIDLQPGQRQQTHSFK
jgi:hypothetical protein